MLEEKTPLLEDSKDEDLLHNVELSQASLTRRISDAILETIRIVMSALSAPGRYVVASFYDDQGRFSAVMPAYRIRGLVSRQRRQPEVQGMNVKENVKGDRAQTSKLKRRPTNAGTGASIDSKDSSRMSMHEVNNNTSRRTTPDGDSPSRHTRSRSILDQVSEDSEEPSPKRSTRIKIVNQDVLRQRKQRREEREMANATSKSSTEEPPLTVDTIKSPTSSMSAIRLDKYPRTTAPPRPLVPRRQPSYTASNPASSEPPQKTLILDLDETLIHSMAKGGRMSTGHMVEVKLDSPVGAGGGVIGPQVPILYYVHKRPHCDEFLRKVSKWYNLIIFTASVQEYADPVIDWLELERKYFSARYYRQHCTYRSGAYIKDLGKVEPDLSKVMILDNSPLSYLFHEDNAIPIEGWISDPTDNDLLNLIPLLEGLQHTTDVRALLALRSGEPKV